jgi:hypothetical protein
MMMDKGQYRELVKQFRELYKYNPNNKIVEVDFRGLKDDTQYMAELTKQRLAKMGLEVVLETGHEPELPSNIHKAWLSYWETILCLQNGRVYQRAIRIYRDTRYGYVVESFGEWDHNDAIKRMVTALEKGTHRLTTSTLIKNVF